VIEPRDEQQAEQQSAHDAAKAVEEVHPADAAGRFARRNDP